MTDPKPTPLEVAKIALGALTASASAETVIQTVRGALGFRGQLLKPADIAAALQVDPKTVSRWAEQGRIHSVITPGGHHRFRECDLDAILAGRFEVSE